MNLDYSNKFIQWIVLALLGLTWGSSFILMKKGLIYFSPEEVAAYRLSVAMIFLLPVSIKSLKILRGKFWPLLATGLFGNAIPAFLFAYAQTEIPSGLSGMLNSLTTLFTLIIGIAFFRAPILKSQIIGVLVALIGAMGLIGFEVIGSFGTYAKYASLIIMATACYGLAVNVIKSFLQEIKPTHITSVAFLLVSPAALIYLLVATPFVTTIMTDSSSWVGLGYLSILGVVGTAIAVVIFNQLIKETTAIFASTVTYLIPIVAIGWGIVDGETITFYDVMYMLLILGGILLINLSRSSIVAKIRKGS
ncbi:MAG: DMT family transporter [Flavobacteriales bacterium]|jgi:drug/metabolite transporter (DMT)-like permease|nr:DMT family transporter [Flavobacteriales bacterium]MBT3964281.1 DMT family transporter [Flavobacteriales bacterium]MBT4705585.1 DMT family transporter [Flavobacteriales bacterium]MBT4931124.1 DMT family transporter [Flavobacteriales bacterium]MBT5133468.1 DMT family transporter [Flavobacteriales bacterium]